MDLHRPEGLEDPEWEAITTAFNRLRIAETNRDQPLIVGSAKELVETVAKVVLRARGTTIRNNADFSEVVSAAHGALGRQPGEGLAADGEIRSVAGAAKTIAVSLGPLRNRYGTGHGQATPPAIVEEHVAVGVDATFLWCRWALRRLEHLIAGRLPVLVSDLHSSIFTRGVLRRRLIAADLPQLPFDEQHLLGVAVGQRAAGGTFVVCEDGVDPCADDLNVTVWPEGYRAGVVEGLFLDARGYVNTTPDLAAKGARILSAVSNVDTVTRRLLDQAGQADWDHRFAEDGVRMKVVEAMRSAAKELPNEQARDNWLALADRLAQPRT